VQVHEYVEQHCEILALRSGNTIIVEPRSMDYVFNGNTIIVEPHFMDCVLNVPHVVNKEEHHDHHKGDEGSHTKDLTPHGLSNNWI
jgi:hypothetical protein